MSIGHDPCERCDARVRTQGDHTCPKCAKLLGRNVRDPWWGDFDGHADAATRPVKEGEQLTKCSGDPFEKARAA